MIKAVRLNLRDNVGIALAELSPGETHLGVPLTEAIPPGFKFALEDIPHESPVRRYGSRIGYSTRPIETGSLVHTQNLGMGDLLNIDPSHLQINPPQGLSPLQDQSFMGYVRPDGKVGTRNIILVMSNVNCSGHVVHEAVKKFKGNGIKDFPNVDGVVAISHDRGCGIAPGTQSAQMMADAMAGFIDHPNVALCIMVGLGCEKAQPSTIIEPNRLIQLSKGAIFTPRYRQPLVLSIQDHGGTEETIEVIRDAIERSLKRASALKRTQVPASKLCFASNCGGSDGYSGITSNRLIGRVSDLIVRCGGSSFLTETTETFGAEHEIIERSSTREIADTFLEYRRWYQDYVTSRGGSCESNPTFGNKAGGITTIAEKALGSVVKSGKAPFAWMINYGQRAPKSGLGFMNGPAYDPAGATGQFAAGANIMLFSTGRGSCFGSEIVPVGKVASNTEMFTRMGRDMDFNAGRLIEGADTDELGWECFQWVLEVASGKKTWSEIHGYGDREFVLWDTGPMT